MWDVTHHAGADVVKEKGKKKRKKMKKQGKKSSEG
jgi:hypothetical protein